MQNHLDSILLERGKVIKDLGEGKKLLKNFYDEVKKFSSPSIFDKRVKELEKLVI